MTDSIGAAHVRRGEEIELEIEALARSGAGEARVRDQRLLVRDALPGERVRVRVESTGGQFARASVLQVLAASPSRVAPGCRHFGTCGGCDVQSLDYDEQLQWKQRRLDETLRRHLASPPELAPIAAPPRPWHQRNKLTLHFAEKQGRLRLGMFRPHSRKVFPIEECPVLSSRAEEVVRRVVAALPDSQLTAQGDHALRALVVRSSSSQDAVHLIVVCGSQRVPGIDALHRALHGMERVGLSMLVTKSPDPSDLDGVHYHLSGPERLEEEIGGLRLASTPTAFFQTSPWGAERLVERVRELLQAPEDATVLDLYCGGGLLSLAVAHQVANVIGIELNGTAVADAKANAAKNGIHNVSFRHAACESLVRDFRYLGHPFAVLLDPPRAGMDEVVLPAIAEQLAPQRILYVSCNPETLARDLSRLAERGYSCVHVEALDMFPHTHHLEALAVCIRENAPA